MSSAVSGSLNIATRCALAVTFYWLHCEMEHGKWDLSSLGSCGAGLTHAVARWDGGSSGNEDIDSQSIPAVPAIIPSENKGNT